MYESGKDWIRLISVTERRRISVSEYFTSASFQYRAGIVNDGLSGLRIWAPQSFFSFEYRPTLFDSKKVLHPQFLVLGEHLIQVFKTCSHEMEMMVAHSCLFVYP
jgi:hypothetical protein